MAPAENARKTILLVEDFQPNVVIATYILEELGYNYEVAGDGHEALKKFTEMDYALIIMDIQMPGIDGLETTRRIRTLEKEKKAAHTPIIAMTAHATEDDRILCLKAGMNDYISKPFELKDLEDKLHHYIG